MKVCNYQVKPGITFFFNIDSIILTGLLVLSFSSNFLRRARHLKWIFSESEICSYNNMPLNQKNSEC